MLKKEREKKDLRMEEKKFGTAMEIGITSQLKHVRQ